MNYCLSLIRLVLRVACLASVVDNISGALTRRPQNIIIANGGLLRVACGSNLTTSTNTPIPVAWRYNGPISNNAAATLYQDGLIHPFDTLFRIDATSPYDLIADVANTSYRGTYTCVDNNGAGEQATAVVQVSIRSPQNAAVLQGDSVTFNCSSNNASVLQWFNNTCNDYRNTDCRTNYGLYNGYTLQPSASPRFNVTGNIIDGLVTRNLYINPVKISDTGVYVCVEVGGAITAANSALLVVLASSTTCTTNWSADDVVDEFDSLNIECSVAYNGNWTPVMRWQNDVTGQNLTSYVTSATSQLMTSRLTLTATSALNATRISCVTYFNDNSATRTVTVSATNIPTYTHKWTSSFIYVHISTNDSVSSTKGTTESNDYSHCVSPQQSCVASGFQSATIALAVIAGVSIAVNILFFIIFYRWRRIKDPKNLSDHEMSDAVSKKNTTLEYQELDITTLSQPTVYASIPQRNP